jgi:hypothetical protein
MAKSAGMAIPATTATTINMAVANTAVTAGIARPPLDADGVPLRSALAARGASPSAVLAPGFATSVAAA